MSVDTTTVSITVDYPDGTTFPLGSIKADKETGKEVYWAHPRLIDNAKQRDAITLMMLQWVTTVNDWAEPEETE